MKSFLETSFLFKVFRKLGGFYENSLLKKVILVIGNWFSQSSTVIGYNRFVEKKPAFRHSVTYRCLATIGSSIDRYIGGILDCLKPFIQKSSSNSLVKTYSSSDRKTLLRITAVVIAFYTLGFAAAMIFKGTWSVKTFIFTITLLLAAMLLYLLEGKLPQWFRNSKLLQLYRYIFD